MGDSGFSNYEIRCGEWNIGAQGKPLRSLFPNLPQGQNGCRCRGVFVVLKSRPGVRRGERVKGVSWTEGPTGSTCRRIRRNNRTYPGWRPHVVPWSVVGWLEWIKEGIIFSLENGGG